MDPIPASSRANTPVLTLNAEGDNLPQHTKPSRIKVIELPESQRKCAESTVSRLDANFKTDHVAAALSQITKVRDESHIRAKRGDRTAWAVLQVEKRDQRETMPSETGADKPSRPPPRLAVSAPLVTKSSLSQPLPGSPMGNAWSGQHYWKPQFSDSVPGTPVYDEDGCAQSDPIRQAVYDSILTDVDRCARQLKAELAQGGEHISDAECEVVAAMTVLEEKDTMFAMNNEFPLPKDIFLKTIELADEQQTALDSNQIRGSVDIDDARRWLQLRPDSLEPMTTLDHVQAGLRVMKEHTESAELEPSRPAYCLVYAVHILEEKIRKLKARESYEEGSDDEMVEYGKFLKSIAEELTVGERERSNLRRDVSESGLEQRRLRGKAPSTFDLEAWASQMKELDPKKVHASVSENII